MILTPTIEMVEDLEGPEGLADLEEDQEDLTKEAMIIETLARTGVTDIIQRMRAPAKIRVYL